MEIRQGSGAVFLSLLLAGCGGEAGESALDRPRFEVTEGLRIGSVDDDADALTYFNDLRVGPAGEIVTYHRQEHMLRIHGSGGALLATAGREGEGPGEFRGSGPIGFRGDSIWVMDFSTYRISYFGLDGAFLRSVRIPIDLGTGGADDPPRPAGLLPDGTLMGRSMLWSREVAAGEITHGTYYRMNEEGAVTDSLVSHSVVHTTLEISDPNSTTQFGSYRPQFFADAELVVLSPYRMEYLHVDRTVREKGPHHYRVTLFHLVTRDTLFSQTYGYEPRPIAADLIDRLVTEMGEPFENHPFPTAPTRARAEQLAREALYVPAHQPRVSSVVAGLDGTWWIQHENVGVETVDWSWVDRQGRVLGITELPKAFRLMVATGQHAWGMLLDELDVPYIVRYDFAGLADGD